MFVQTWKKYLPVIAILMKRSTNGEQTLNMNYSDFVRAAGGRKLKFNFSNLVINNGRVDNTTKHAPIVKEFAQVLQENDQTRALIKNQQFEFAMNSDFQLLIKNSTVPAEPTNGEQEIAGDTVES